MTKDEARLAVMGAISMALNDPTLQVGFEIICKELSDFEKENAELKDKLNNLSSVAAVRLANWQKYEKENAELKVRLNAINLLTPELEKRSKAKKKQLAEAKELLIGFVSKMKNTVYTPYEKDLVERAEQFLKEE